MKTYLRNYWQDAAVVAFFLLLSFVYFASPLSQGMVLGGHDTVAGIGLGHEIDQYSAATGETTRWTGSIFSGMPTYQIAPSYGSGSLIGYIGTAIGLFTSGALGYLFMYLLGFYILMRAFGIRQWVSALGAMAWAFSSYFLIIIAAGHLWKVATLGFIPPTIGGLVLCYRQRLLLGGAVTALFTALQVHANHMQMTYYFLYVMALIVIAYGVAAVIGRKRDEILHYCRATLTIVAAGLLGALANGSNLYHTWQYQKESMRGGQVLKGNRAGQNGAAAETSGLDHNYITAWSYGIDETMTLMIPDFKGGGSKSVLTREGVENLDGYQEFYEHAGMLQQAYQQQGQQGPMPGIVEYWGDQPFTVGPVYAGAIICFLFILGIILVGGPIKWALVLATLLSFVFAWGHNIGITGWIIDNVPMYNKFRTVSSALVIAEMTMPLLAMLALWQIIREPKALLETRRGRIALGSATVLTLGTCLLFAFAPGIANNLSSEDAAAFSQLSAAGMPDDFLRGYRSAILSMHADVLGASAMRSALLIAVALGAILAYCRGILRQDWILCGILAVACIGDLWNVDKRYLNDESFADPTAQLEGFQKTPADETILADRDPNFRVVNLSGGSPFNETSNQTAYWHKHVGGYHAAKLRRYQDLIDRYLEAESQRVVSTVGKKQAEILSDKSPYAAHQFETEAEFLDLLAAECHPEQIAPMLCMLNTRYFILGGGKIALRNPGAQGNGWFVRDLRYVEGPDAEIHTLGKIDVRTMGVAEESQRAVLGTAKATDEGTVTLTSYKPNALQYTTDSKTGGIVVLSEVWYPGWTATIDGTPVELARANYLLRALRVPAGKHEIVLTFEPQSVTTTEAIAYVALLLILAAFAAAIWRGVRKAKAA